MRDSVIVGGKKPQYKFETQPQSGKKEPPEAEFKPACILFFVFHHLKAQQDDKVDWTIRLTECMHLITFLYPEACIFITASLFMTALVFLGRSNEPLTSLACIAE